MAVPRGAWGRSRRTPVPTPHSEGQPPRLATPAVGPLRHLDDLVTDRQPASPGVPPGVRLAAGFCLCVRGRRFGPVALYGRTTTGQGTHIRLSMFDTIVEWMAF